MGPDELTRHLIATLGGRYSSELGIDVDRGLDQVERWVFAATHRVIRGAVAPRARRPPRMGSGNRTDLPPRAARHLARRKPAAGSSGRMGGAPSRPTRAVHEKSHRASPSAGNACRTRPSRRRSGARPSEPVPRAQNTRMHRRHTLPALASISVRGRSASDDPPLRSPPRSTTTARDLRL